ncbi:MAG TPA: phospholipid carrier-dependent glycosyltransferase [Sideroxyarcus sp.]|nr:phospholipid carrier-dependent glycosyltransferase [Sideroxyarcus sp.]
MLNQNSGARARLAWFIMACLLAVFVYFYGLGSQHIPKNSDEYLYVHVARMTAESGHWLPLQSELDYGRNFKPPMMFWHAIAATDWGKHWDLWHLRYPSVIYTLLTSLLVFLLAKRLTGKTETGFVAALTFVAFFSTYRFGRPYLTDPGIVFWLFLPFFALLYWRPFTFESRWLPVLLGLLTGVGLLYKSFFFVLPVGLGLSWWYLHHRQYRWREFLVKDLWKPVVTGVIGLLVFGLWFLLEPDTVGLWNEFFWKENMGKVQSGNYLGTMLWGPSSIWSLSLGYPQNAGLLGLPVLGLFWTAFRQRKQTTDTEKYLWIWMAALFFMFSLASQRSARYLLEAMPALAVLMAFYWERIDRKWFVGALLMAGLVLALLLRMSLRLQDESGGALYGWSYWALLAATAALLLFSLFASRYTRITVNVVMLLTYLTLASFLHPFDGARGNYSAEAQQFAAGKDVWVPCNKFIAKDEGHRFLMPGANVLGYYDDVEGLDSAALAKRYRYFAVRMGFGEKPCDDCKVIGERLEINGRQYAPEIKQMLLEGKVFEHLFVKEVLIESRVAAPSVKLPAVSECR